MIEESVRIHDRHQVEIKLAYGLDDFARPRSFDVSMFFFVPASLAITSATYSKRNFFNDLISYVRIKTPATLLRNMTSSAGPLSKLEHALTSLAQDPNQRTESAYEYCLKMFCCILKSALRDHTGALAGRSAAVDQNQLAEEFLSSVSQITEAFRALRAIINVPSVKEEAFLKFLFADEFVSLLVESYAYQMLEACKEHKNGAFETYKLRLLKLIEDEVLYRSTQGYPSIPEANSDNETFVFRMSVLKKWSENVLFLGTRTKREGAVTEQGLFALAAGLSMVFATAVAFLVQDIYGNLTFPFFVALVVSYMFKDRLKESLRTFLNVRARRFFYDRRRQIFSDTEGTEKIGTFRESFDFAQEKSIPTSVRKLRSRDHITEIENGWLGETVLLYRKRVNLFPDWFKRMQTEYRVQGINDILRLDVSGFLSRMDEPTKDLWITDGSEYWEISGERVYHINLVMRCLSGTSLHERRFRLVLNKDGVKRVEPVNADHTMVEAAKPTMVRVASLPF